MEPTELQLVLNVVMITSVTSLAGYCYLLKKENRRLMAQRKTKVEVRPSAPAPHPAPGAPAVVEQDIRKFAAGRRSGWVKNLASSIS